MKIIRPVEVTDSIVTENTAYPPEVNAWEAQGFAVIPSSGSDAAIVDMAFSGTQNKLFIGGTSGTAYVVETDGTGIISGSYSSIQSVARSPATPNFAIAYNDGDTLRVVNDSLGIINQINTSSVTEISVDRAYFTRIFWENGLIYLYQVGDKQVTPGGFLRITVALDESTLAEQWRSERLTEPGGTQYDAYQCLYAREKVLIRETVGGSTTLYILNPTTGATVDTVSIPSDQQSMVSAVMLPDESAIYFTVSGTNRGLYKLSGAGYGTLSTIFQPVGIPTEPGRLKINSDGSFISIATGFQSHILATATDTFEAGTDRAAFKSSENTTVIPFSSDDALVAVSPKQPDDLGIYNLWQTASWMLVTASTSDYLIGDRTYEDKTLYEALIDNPNTAPSTGVSTDPPQWLMVGSINPWRMFDGATNTQTSGATPMTISLEPGALVNGIAFFSVDAGTLQVTMTDPVEGLVYDSGEIQMLDNSAITNWYAYFFDPYVPRPDLALLDLPPYPDATITATLTSEGQDIQVGEIVFGSIQRLGAAQYGTSVGIIDFSRKEQDQFGNFSILQRRFSKRAEYDVKINTGAASGVQRTLANYRTTPVVWVGDETKDETIVYGYYRDFEILLSGPSLSDCTITVEGL